MCWPITPLQCRVGCCCVCVQVGVSIDVHALSLRHTHPHTHTYTYTHTHTHTLVPVDERLLLDVSAGKNPAQDLKERPWDTELVFHELTHLRL
jgi:hypothetical protein